MQLKSRPDNLSCAAMGSAVKGCGADADVPTRKSRLHAKIPSVVPLNIAPPNKVPSNIVQLSIVSLNLSPSNRLGRVISPGLIIKIIRCAIYITQELVSIVDHVRGATYCNLDSL